MTTERSSKDLEAGLIHWGYELASCVECAVQLQLLPPGSLLQNACLEAHLLHARGLVEFLVDVKSAPHVDDMLRTDFATQWTPTPADAVSRANCRKTDINKHLAHLTWQRVDNVDPILWTYRQSADDILAIAHAWAEHVNDCDRILGRLALVQVEAARHAFDEYPADVSEELTHTTN